MAGYAIGDLRERMLPSSFKMQLLMHVGSMQCGPSDVSDMLEASIPEDTGRGFVKGPQN